MALFGHGSGLVTELPTLAVLMAHFGHYIANFDGVPSELPPGGSSVTKPLPGPKSAIRLPRSAVL